jgi:hypothetical protein
MGETRFKLSTKSDIEILGPPEKIETISSDLASKNTRVKKAFGRIECTLFNPSKADFIFSLAVFKSLLMPSKAVLYLNEAIRTSLNVGDNKSLIKKYLF